MPRFDEIELEGVSLVPDVAADPAIDAAPVANSPAPRMRRLFALLTDLSLFAALTLALWPLLPGTAGWMHVVSLAGFVVVLSYYYFAGTWLLWGKTIGGAIFDVKVVSTHGPAMDLRSATMRWVGTYVALATAGIGFLFALLPSRLSLPDRMSDTRCIAP